MASVGVIVFDYVDGIGRYIVGTLEVMAVF